MKQKYTHKAVFEVKFDKSFMIDDDSLKKYYKNNLEKYMKGLYKEEGLGVFLDDLKLVRIEELPDKKLQKSLHEAYEAKMAIAERRKK